MRDDFQSKLRWILIEHAHERIRLGEAMRQVKALVYEKRDKFFYEGRMKNAIDHKIMVEHHEIEK